MQLFYDAASFYRGRRLNQASTALQDRNKSAIHPQNGEIWVGGRPTNVLSQSRIEPYSPTVPNQIIVRPAFHFSPFTSPLPNTAVKLLQSLSHLMKDVLVTFRSDRNPSLSVKGRASDWDFATPGEREVWKACCDIGFPRTAHEFRLDRLKEVMNYDLPSFMASHGLYAKHGTQEIETEHGHREACYVIPHRIIEVSEHAVERWSLNLRYSAVRLGEVLLQFSSPSRVEVESMVREALAPALKSNAGSGAYQIAAVFSEALTPIPLNKESVERGRLLLRGKPGSLWATSSVGNDDPISDLRSLLEATMRLKRDCYTFSSDEVLEHEAGHLAHDSIRTTLGARGNTSFDDSPRNLSARSEAFANLQQLRYGSIEAKLRTLLMLTLTLPAASDGLGDRWALWALGETAAGRDIQEGSKIPLLQRNFKGLYKLMPHLRSASALNSLVEPVARHLLYGPPIDFFHGLPEETARVTLTPRSLPPSTQTGGLGKGSVAIAGVSLGLAGLGWLWKRKRQVAQGGKL
jgi:hypothetical protein